MYNTSINISKWYSLNKRDLPWRKSRDPYKIWLSEVMLQQTQVETVIPYYERWLNKYPTVNSVASEKIDKLLKIWEGLGYYSRCRNFHEATKEIIKSHNGVIPNQFGVFKSLKGVGNYIAGAVMSIAFNQPYVAIDGNQQRVIARVLGIKNLTQRNRKRLNLYLSQLVNYGNSGDINQALMDIGSSICKPRKVDCTHCPFRLTCKAHKFNDPLGYPIIIAKQKIPTKRFAAMLIRHKDNIFINKRAESGLLGGLWELPNVEIHNGSKSKTLLKEKLGCRFGCEVKVGPKLGAISHAFTHFKMNIDLFDCQLNNNPTLKTGEKWVAFSDIDQYAFSKANHKLFELVDVSNG
ncbi:MAG: A/G-specific adenine glycosylase [Candidatus Marinimicrobia bacterium]|nr:A/G-specific adenine glycosylase [Candidatus Neomarinimicrobiota bacterium]